MDLAPFLFLELHSAVKWGGILRLGRKDASACNGWMRGAIYTRIVPCASLNAMRERVGQE
jgi:hypothetical protein